MGSDQHKRYFRILANNCNVIYKNLPMISLVTMSQALILLWFIASFIIKENTFSTTLMTIKMLFFFLSSQTFLNSMTLRLKNSTGRLLIAAQLIIVLS